MRGFSLAGSPVQLDETLNSGQVFHWTAHRGGWVGCIGNKAAFLKSEDGRLRFTGVSVDEVRRYLSLDHDLEAITRSFRRDDDVIGRAVAYAPHLRILRQPRWECLASFITSSLKQVSQIRAISLRLRERFGTGHDVRGLKVYSYPDPAVLAEAGENKLRECGLGYRAAYLCQCARSLAEGEVDLEEWKDLCDDELFLNLTRLPGVGPKIARCVMLFGYERLDAFPVDVWVERVVRERYYSPSRRKELTTKQVENFARRQFPRYAGYAQQFLFHHARTGEAGGRSSLT